MRIYDLLANDHRNVMQIFAAIDQSRNAEERKHLLTLAHTELAMHSKAEEEVFYRPLRDRLDNDTIIHHSFDEHDQIDKLLAKLQVTSADDKEWMDNVHKLRDIVARHVQTEENTVFTLAQTELSEAEAVQTGISFLAQKGKLGMPNPLTVAALKVKELVSGD